MVLRFFTLIVFTLLISGCGTGATGTNVEGDTAKPDSKGAIIDQIELTVEATNQGESILFDVAISNKGETDAELTFPSGQLIEMKVTEKATGEHVYTYSMDKLFIQSITTQKIAAGDSIKIEDVWEVSDNLSYGTYSVNVSLLATEINGTEIEGKETNTEFTYDPQNVAFRNIDVTGENGSYRVTGEARVFEASFFYAVEDGHEYIMEETVIRTDEGAPSWSPFTIDIQIPEENLPINGVLTLELYERSAKDGSMTNVLYIPMEKIIR